MQAAADNMAKSVENDRNLLIGSHFEQLPWSLVQRNIYKYVVLGGISHFYLIGDL